MPFVSSHLQGNHKLFWSKFRSIKFTTTRDLWGLSLERKLQHRLLYIQRCSSPSELIGNYMDHRKIAFLMSNNMNNTSQQSWRLFETDLREPNSTTNIEIIYRKTTQKSAEKRNWKGHHTCVCRSDLDVVYRSSHFPFSRLDLRGFFILFNASSLSAIWSKPMYKSWK